ncbi:CRE-LEM-3 protein, partial [Aphelenchoides avenae]
MGAVLPQDKKFVLHLLAGSDTATALDAAKKLLDAGTHTVNERESAEQLTALHIAAAWGNLSMCQLLIHYGADVNAVDAKGRKPADLATENCRKLFAKMDKPEEKRRLLKLLAYIFNRRLIEKVTRRKGRISYPMKDAPRPTAQQMLSETLPCGPGPADGISPAVLEALASLTVADKQDGWVHVSIPSKEANSVRMLYPRLSILDSSVPTPSAPPEALVVYDELSRP